ncbi:hypothetical protein F5879DRAFT_1006264 [Lentinula edodes]|nr:hypothetical protein F5879DRAFT_1006264 [Lentinula edodes]
MRRKPLFITNTIALLFAIALAFTNIFILLRSVRQPTVALDRPSTLAFVFVMMMVEIFIDSILFFRVFIILPPARISRRMAMLLYVPLVAFKSGRIINAIIFMVLFTKQTRSLTVSAQYAAITLQRPEPKIGWLLQIADNLLCSSIFLAKLHQVRSMSLRVGGDDGQASFAQRVGVLFWIALSNFVFPAMVTTVLLILNFVDNNYSHYFLVFICNIFVETYGVIFATMWTSISKQESGGLPSAGVTSVSIRFAVPTIHSSVSSTSHTESTTQGRSIVDDSLINLRNFKALPSALPSV